MKSGSTKKNLPSKQTKICTQKYLLNPNAVVKKCRLRCVTYCSRQLLIAGLIVNTQVGFDICGLAVKERIHKLKVDSSSYI